MSFDLLHITRDAIVAAAERAPSEISSSKTLRANLGAIWEFLSDGVESSLHLTSKKDHWRLSGIAEEGLRTMVHLSGQIIRQSKDNREINNRIIEARCIGALPVLQTLATMNEAEAEAVELRYGLQDRTFDDPKRKFIMYGSSVLTEETLEYQAGQAEARCPFAANLTEAYPAVASAVVRIQVRV